MTSTSSPSTPSLTFLSLLQCQQYHSKPLTSFRSTRSKRIVNLHGHRIIEDCYTARWPSSTSILSAVAAAGVGPNSAIRTSKPVSQFSDEELLARFTRGFFGGRVFVPERILLVNAGVAKRFGARFEGYKQCMEQEQKGSTVDVQSPYDIPNDKLLPVNSKIYGAFQVLDSQLLRASNTRDQSTVNLTKTGTEPEVADYSYIDVCFGTGSFGGCHRFSIHRHYQSQHQQPFQSRAAKDGEAVTLSLAHFTCNPVDGKDDLAKVRYLNRFHQLYARLLFADALRGVLGHYC